MNEWWEVDEYKEMKRREVTALVRTYWTKTETMKGSIKSKSFVKHGDEWFQFSNLDAFTVFYGYHYHQKWARCHKRLYC